MTGLAVDDLYGKALSKKHWDQKCIISEKEEKAFKQSMSKPNSQQKIGYIEF